MGRPAERERVRHGFIDGDLYDASCFLLGKVLKLASGSAWNKPRHAQVDEVIDQIPEPFLVDASAVVCERGDESRIHSA